MHRACDFSVRGLMGIVTLGQAAPTEVAHYLHERQHMDAEMVWKGPIPLRNCAVLTNVSVVTPNPQGWACPRRAG